MKIVWQNPNPVITTQATLQRISSDQFGSVYAVITPDVTQQFEVILGEAA